MRAETLFKSVMVAVLAVGAASAMDGVRGPVSGLLIDAETKAVRPIVGIPGAAYAGAAAVGRAESALGSPDGTMAVLAKDGELHLLSRLETGVAVWRPLGVSSEGWSGRGAWSEDGGRVALIYSEPSRALVVESRNAEAAARWLDMNGLDGRVAAVAAGADGSVAVVVESEWGAGIYALLSEGGRRFLFGVSRLGGIAESAGSLWVADRERNDIVRVTNWRTSPEVSVVASEAHGISDPVGLALAGKGRMVIVANGEGRDVVAVGVDEGRVMWRKALEFSPEGLERSGAVFLLSAGAAGVKPARVMDAASYGVFFVPMPAEKGEQEP